MFKITQETLDNVSDDLQLKIDDFLEDLEDFSKKLTSEDTKTVKLKVFNDFAEEMESSSKERDLKADKLRIFKTRKLREITEEGVRSVCVDYPHVPAETVNDIFKNLIKDYI